MLCPRCQHENRPQAKFCEECGGPLTAIPTGAPAPSYAQVTSALSEALEQQTATAEILRVMSSSPTDVQPVLDAIARSAIQLCGAAFGAVLLVDGENVDLAAHCGFTPEGLQAFRKAYPRHVDRTSLVGQALLDRSMNQTSDITHEVGLGTRSLGPALGFRSQLNVPLLHDGVAIGVIGVARAEAGLYSPAHVALLETFANQAVIAIENVRLFTELQLRNRELTETLEQQMATSEILRVIARSPTDMQPVLDAMAESAARLCAAYDASILRLDGNVLRSAAHYGPIPTNPVRLPVPVIRGTVNGRAVLDRQAVQVADLQAEVNEFPEGSMFARDLGHRTSLSVPLLREGIAIGTIGVRRTEVQPFTDKQVALLRTFADQAVIAIENARLFRELADKSQQLEAASRHKSEFLANMSHELRTPLNAIIGFSEVLAERMFGEVNEKQAEYLQDILSSGRHLLSLINDILDLSKVEAGRLELELGQFHLPTTLDNAVTLIRERASRHGIALAQTVDDGVGHIVADERKVKQILLNLLSNAVKFTSEGGRIGLTAKAAEEVVTIAVSDTGIGIAPEDQAAAFEEFRQVGRHDARTQEGTGLGLTLTKKFVELHGGRIWVQSQVGQGSTFTFTLPVRPSN